ITVDGREVHVPNGELLIKAAQEHGTYIPRFCWHDRMKPVGMCRMCLVEVEGLRGLQIACATPVYDGMVVHSQTDNVRKAPDGVLEFLLINHPLDCPVCDRGGECPLQDQTLAFGPGESRYVEEKRHFEKPTPISDLVLLDRERCIQCGRCTRFAAEIAGDPLIDFGGRGELAETSWPEALDAAAAGLRKVLDVHGPEGVAVLGGGRGTNEDAYVWSRFAKGVLGTDNVDAQLGDGLPADIVLGLPRATI